MSKIVEFDPSKRQIVQQLEFFKKMMSEIAPDQVAEIMFYVKTEDEKIHCAAYGPTWEMTGRLKTFLHELEIELYATDFLDESMEDELE